MVSKPMSMTLCKRVCLIMKQMSMVPLNIEVVTLNGCFRKKKKEDNSILADFRRLTDS